MLHPDEQTKHIDRFVTVSCCHYTRSIDQSISQSVTRATRKLFDDSSMKGMKRMQFYSSTKDMVGPGRPMRPGKQLTAAILQETLSRSQLPAVSSSALDINTLQKTPAGRWEINGKSSHSRSESHAKMLARHWALVQGESDNFTSVLRQCVFQ